MMDRLLSRPPMPDEARLSLDAHAKFSTYRRPPFKLVLHLCILTAVTLQTLWFQTREAGSIRATRHAFNHIFGGAARYLYTIESFESDVSNVLLEYVDLHSKETGPLDRFEKIGPLTIEYSYYSSNRVFSGRDFDDSVVKKTVSNVSELPNDFKDGDLVRRLVHADVEFELASFAGLTSNIRKCLVWRIAVSYKFTTRGRMTADTRASIVSNCGSVKTLDWSDSQPLMWLNVLLVMLCSLYAALTLKAVRAKYRAAANVNASKMVLLWDLFTLLGCLLTLTASAMNLNSKSSHSPTSGVHLLTSSTGVACVWATSAGFLRHSPKHYSLAHTLHIAAPRLLHFVPFLVPLFVSYVLFGLVYFGSTSERFANFAEVSMLLFSVLNGDIIFETFSDLHNGKSFLVAMAFLTTFMIFFVYVVLNLFVAVIEESYFINVLKKKYDDEDDVETTQTTQTSDVHTLVARLTNQAQ